MNYWQVAAGDSARDYTDAFLQFGVMLIGPGNPGHYFDRKDYYRSRKWGSTIVTIAEKVTDGDIVILKRPHKGQWQIRAVGRVVSDYSYLEQFDDVQGWDLQHCRKVEWICPAENQKVFTSGLTRGTLSRVYKKEPIQKALEVLEEGEKRKVEDIPTPAKAISDEDLVETLIGNGLRPADAETVIQTIWRVRRLARWYARYGRDMSEHETRTFLIAPVLLALGWSEQKIKIEWKGMDIALFQDVYRRGQSPLVILESKRMGEGLHFAERQAVKYARDYPECRRLVVSDGTLYQLYVRQGETWNMQTDFKAHMNLLNLKDRHPYWVHIGGAPELFVNLMPK